MLNQAAKLHLFLASPDGAADPPRLSLRLSARATTEIQFANPQSAI
jgi:hypothetical protein